jgi:Peptidase family S41/N-terminal domain of Peptidase_S41 in eukaryotic IRBP
VLLALSVVLAVAAPSSYRVQNAATGPDTTVDARTRAEVIQGVLRRIEEGYVFPQKAAEMEQAVRARARRGEYDSIVSAEALAGRLTKDLRAVSHDLHLEVVYDSKGVVDEGSGGDPLPGDQSQLKLYGRRINWGLERVERLKGNVGYLQIRSFNFDGSLVDSTLAAAMSFLAGTDALIVDVRDNGGGEPSYVARVCSYFLPPNTLINKFYWRPQNRWDEFRTSRVSGKYYGTARPVYVLTSNGTFSGAEEFAYDVQTQRRGEIVG